MSQDISLEDIVRRIVMQTGLSREEIMQKIDEAITNVNGLLTRVGAALVLAEKLKVTIDLNKVDRSTNETSDVPNVKIKDIMDNMRNVVVIGRITSKYPVKTFQRQDGRRSSVASISIQDATGSIRVNLWEQKAGLVEEEIDVGDIITIINGYTKLSTFTKKVEINVDNKGKIQPAAGMVDERDFPTAPTLKTMQVKDLPGNEGPCTFVAKIVEKYPPKVFTKDGAEKQVARVHVADDTGDTHVVFWTESMGEYQKINTGRAYKFDNVNVKKNNLSGGIEVHVGRATKITESNQEINAKVLPVTPGNNPAPGGGEIQLKDIHENEGFRTVIVKILEKTPPRAFTKDGEEKQVARVHVADDTGDFHVVFWTESMGEYQKIETDHVYKFEGVNVKKNNRIGTMEMHVGRSTKITESNQEIDAKVQPGGNPGMASSELVIVTGLGNVPSGASSLVISGTVAWKSDVREWEKEGKRGFVARVKLIDKDNNTVTVVFWTGKIDEFKSLNVGDVIELKDVYSKENRGQIEVSVKDTTTIDVKGTENITITREKIGNLKENQSMLSIEGRVVSMGPEKEITTRDGNTVKNMSIVIADETGSIIVTAWRDDVQKIKEFKEGDPVSLENVATAMNNYQKSIEVRLGRESKINRPSTTSVPGIDQLPKGEMKLPIAVPGSLASRVKLDAIEENMRVEILAHITNVSPFLNHYLACPKCNKKVVAENDSYYCNNDGAVSNPRVRLIARVTADDGNGNISVTMIGDPVLDLFQISEQEAKEIVKSEDATKAMIERVKDRLLLKTYIFRGKVKFNQYRNEMEIIADGVQKADLQKETSNIINKAGSAS